MNARLFRLMALSSLVVVAACKNGAPPYAVGTLERDRLDLVAESSEPVVNRPVPEGGFVRAGTLLLALDPTRLEAQVAQATSSRARAEARLAELARGPRKERIDEARARLRGANGTLTAAQQLLQRAEALAPGEAVSRELVDERRARFLEARASRDASRASLVELLDGTMPEEIAQAEATLAEADAIVADAQVRLERLQVRAPTDGWVDALPYEIGERPPAGGVVAVLLAARNPYARVYVPAAVRLSVASGTPANVRIDGLDSALRGKVRTVATDPSFTPFFALTERDRGRVVYLAKVDLVDEDAQDLPAGIPVEVEFVDTSRTEREASNAGRAE